MLRSSGRNLRKSQPDANDYMTLHIACKIGKVDTIKKYVEQENQDVNEIGEENLLTIVTLLHGDFTLISNQNQIKPCFPLLRIRLHAIIQNTTSIYLFELR